MYATVEEANAYIASYYGSTDTSRVSWEALSNGDKQVQLNKASKLIDQLPLKGKPKQTSSAFPRTPDESISLDKAKEASIVLAVSMLGEADVQMRIALRQQGVKEYKIGDLSERFEGVSVDYGLDKWVYSIVFPILRTWLSGGYTIYPGARR